MGGPKGFAAVEKLARRAKEQRGGKVAVRQDFDRSAPDALALWRDAYLESLASRNYSAGTLEGRPRCLEAIPVLGSRTGPPPGQPGYTPDPGDLPAVALALHSPQWPTPGLEHASATA